MLYSSPSNRYINSTLAEISKRVYFHTMGKPSLKSRKSSRIRKKNRKIRMLKELKDKEVEVSDLQIQMQDFKKSLFDSGEILLNKFEKCSHENNNLVEWLKIYDNQIKEYEKEMYDLNVRLYLQSQQPQPQQRQSQRPQSQQHQSQQSQPQQHQSLAEYFDYIKNHE